MISVKTCPPLFVTKHILLCLVDSKVEAKVVVQALRLNTLSKLTFADLKRFDGLVRDIFPNVEFQDVDYEKLADAVRESAQELNLVVMPTQVSSRAILGVIFQRRNGIYLYAEKRDVHQLFHFTIHLMTSFSGETWKVKKFIRTRFFTTV